MIAAASAQPSEAEIEREARRIHDRVITLDTHVDISLEFATHEDDPGGFTDNQVDLPKMRAGGLDAAFFIVYTPQGPLTGDGYREARQIAETRWTSIDRFVRAYPNQVELALTARDVERIHREGKRVALIGMENPYPLGPSVADVPLWHARGVRYMGLTHFGHNQFGDSSNPNPARDTADNQNGGLTELGRELVRALNDAGIMIDVSHAGRETMLQAAELSRAPIIASHSGSRALVAHPRGLDDEQMRALARNGGVAQAVGLSRYVKDYPPEIQAAVDALRARYGVETEWDLQNLSEEDRQALQEAQSSIEAGAPRATVADFVDHIDHMVEVAGIDHVGISSDFDGGGGVVGWENAAETLNVTKELVRRGYSEADIAKIWGGNLLRVMREVERAARR
ncbi:MAG: pyoverdine-tailoring dipeptidase-like protein PvdM [Parvularculaceae bacterium]